METTTLLKKNTLITGQLFATSISVLFVILTAFWLCVHPFNPDAVTNRKNLWSATYELISIAGGIFGLIASKRWGGFKTVLGRAILAFSIGLFLQAFGQTVYNYYTLAAHIQAPYPSLGDIGYFGSVIAYIYAGLVLLRGMKFPARLFGQRSMAFLIPLAMLAISYMLFLKGYQNTGSTLTTFLDFGYPLGQAIYVSIAMLVMYMSKDYLGGMMKKPIMLLLLALVVQYICDFDFLYQANHGIWYAGGIGDYLYMVSYFLMALALINIGEVRLKMESN